MAIERYYNACTERYSDIPIMPIRTEDSKAEIKAELEEIKAEIIKRKCKYCDIDANIQKCLEEHDSLCDVADILVIIDNRISELKGENNEQI